ncbi:hypothetical protein Tco_0345121 [Tanacetum coccineum]
MFSDATWLLDYSIIAYEQVPYLPLKSPVYHEPSVASVVSASVVDRSVSLNLLSRTRKLGHSTMELRDSTQSKGYRVYNKRTRLIVESIHIKFDEIKEMMSDHNSSDLAPQRQEMSVENVSSRPGSSRTKGVADRQLRPRCPQRTNVSGELVGQLKHLARVDITPKVSYEQERTRMKTQRLYNSQQEVTRDWIAKGLNAAGRGVPTFSSTFLISMSLSQSIKCYPEKIRHYYNTWSKGLELEEVYVSLAIIEGVPIPLIRGKALLEGYSKGRTQSLVAEKTDISENRASRNFDLMINMMTPRFSMFKRRLIVADQASVFMAMTFEQRSSSLVLHQMTSDHNRSELGIQDHINEQSSSKLVPKVVP